ncbi:MAG: hypothetical protein MZW92_72170 [Comamonadaceae bacterium]|nr:hypothetical protein [Comamonadaceae bacterium]
MLLELFTLEKACYELRYELDNRPTDQIPSVVCANYITTNEGWGAMRQSVILVFVLAGEQDARFESLVSNERRQPPRTARRRRQATGRGQRYPAT